MLNLSSTFHKKPLKIGTRSSPLALIQTKNVVELLKERIADIEYEIVTPENMKTRLRRRDLLTTDHLSYNKLSRLALSLNELDFIVHSMKDVKISLTPEFVIGCVCLRDSCEDVVVMRKDLQQKTLEELPAGSVIGTSSMRRKAKMRSQYPQHEIISIKGDIDKRISKLDNPEVQLPEGEKPYSALILAKAGITRLNLQHRISQELKLDDGYYAVGQGALACECRADDEETLKILSFINDEKSMLSCIAERSLIKSLDCRASEAVSVQSIFTESKFTLKVRVSNNSGNKFIEKEDTVDLPDSVSGTELGNTSEKKQFTGISVWGLNKTVTNKMLACEELGENVSTILKMFQVDSILLENKNEKKLSRYRR